MSIMYFLEINLEVKYTEKNVNFILKNISKQDCFFLAKEEDKELTVGSCFLTLEQATAKIVDATDEARSNYEDTLLVKCKDTYCDLRFYRKENDLLMFSLFGFSCPWGKNFWYGKSDFVIDFARYINLGIDIVKDLSLLGLEMSSDHSNGWPEEIGKNCAIAIIDMGSLNELIPGSVEGVKGSLDCIIRNGFQNGIVFFDENIEQSITPSAQQYYDELKVGFSVYLYAGKSGISFKIEINQNIHGYDGIAIYPLEPYCMKKGCGSQEEKIDVAFYTQRLLELCENFAIYELKTFF